VKTVNRPTRRLGRLLAAAAVTAAAFSLPVALPATSAAAAPVAPALCRDPNQTGVCQEVTTDIADLNGSVVGDNTVTSVRVPTGWYVVLYEHPNYRGACQEFNTDDGWLPASIVGDDRASSVMVRRTPGTCDKMTVDTPRRGINHFETFTVEYFCPATHAHPQALQWESVSTGVSVFWTWTLTGMLVTYTNWNLTGDQGVGMRMACGTALG
jgi:hypothetical protein